MSKLWVMPTGSSGSKKKKQKFTCNLAFFRYQVEFHGRVEVLLDFHCRRMQLDRQRQRFQFEKNGREVTPEWVTFENHLMENCEQINIISIDAPEYQLMRFVTDVTSYEPETEETEDQAVERQGMQK